MGPLAQLFEATVRRHVEPSARVLGYEPAPTPERDRAYGTAAVQRYVVELEDRSGRKRALTLLTKDAPLVERRVLQLLSGQGLAGIPYSHAPDTVTDGLAPVCQQDLAPHSHPPSEVLVRAATERLAGIHLTNLGRVGEPGWLPRADRAYFEGGFVLGDCWEQWDETMRIEEFAREWNPERPRLEAAAARFLADMDRLWAEGESLTLIHADLHGDHVLAHNGEPYFIDWGQARYGSFYLDLPNLFTPEQSQLYREALATHGVVIPEDLFRERYRAASRYVAFKYLGYTMWAYRNGGAPLARGRWELFETAMRGR